MLSQRKKCRCLKLEPEPEIFGSGSKVLAEACTLLQLETGYLIDQIQNVLILCSLCGVDTLSLCLHTYWHFLFFTMVYHWYFVFLHQLVGAVSQ